MGIAIVSVHEPCLIPNQYFNDFDKSSILILNVESLFAVSKVGFLGMEFLLPITVHSQLKSY